MARVSEDSFDAPEAPRVVVRARFLLLSLLFLLVSLALYGRILQSYFLSDDFRRVGSVVEHGLHSGWQRFFRPVVVLSFVIDEKLWHLEPLGYHLTNLLFHTVNSILVVCLSISLLRTLPMSQAHVFLLSSLAGLLFLVLPSHTESVSWISGRTDLIATCFMLASLIAYCVYCRTRRARMLLIALASFFLALLAKESAVSLPFVVLLCTIPFALDHASTDRLSTFALGPLLFFGALAAYALLRYAVLGVLVGGHGTEAHLGFDAPLLFYKAICMALRTFLPPVSDQLAHLVASHAYLSPRRLAALALLSIVAVFGLARFLTVSRLGRSPLMRRLLCLIAVLAASFWVTSPLLGNQGVHLNDTQGERFLYTPSVFASIAAVCVLSLAGRLWLFTVPLALFITIVSAVHTHRVNENWRMAGELSRTLVHDIAAQATHPQVVLANVPDNYNGAYVLRNGLDEAVRIFGRAGHVRTATALSFHDVRSIDDGVTVQREGGAPRAYRLRLTDDHASFVKVADNERAVTHDRSGGGFAFDFVESRDGVDLLFYSAGRIHKVTGQHP